MSSILNIKPWISFLFLMITFGVMAQENKSDTNNPPNNSSREKTVTLAVGTLMPSAIEDSNFGKASEGKLSFEIGAQVFIYKGLFIGFFHSSTYFDITDQDLVGNYDKTSIAAYYLKLGYELEILNKFSITGTIAPIGNARYKNIINRGRIKQQIDDANIMLYDIALAYNFSKTISAYLQYSFRSDKTKIQTAPEILNDFDKINYHNITLGLRFSLGDEALFK